MRFVARLIVLSLLMIALIGLPLRSQAQNNVEWLVISSDDGLAAVTDARLPQPVDVPFCGQYEDGTVFDSPLYLAPNGDHIAYLTRQIDEDGNERHALRLCHGIDLEERLLTPNNVGSGDRYSIPAWSTDSSRLAYISGSIFSDQSTVGIAIYNLNTETTLQVRATVPLNVSADPQLIWNEQGIFISSAADIENGLPAEVVHFSPDGVLLDRFSLPDNVTDMLDLMTVTRNDTETPLITLPNGNLFILDTLSGNWTPIQGVLDLLSTQTNQSIALRYFPDGDNARWEALSPSGERFSLPYNGTWATRGIALSPDGNLISFIDGDTSYLWNDGTLTTLEDINTSLQSSVVWATLRWRLIEA